MCQILNRLKEYIDLKGLSISAFEKSIGMSNASFGKQLKKKGAIGTDKLEHILTVYSDLSPLWLMTGEGEMLKTNTINQELNNLHQKKTIKSIICNDDPFDSLMHPAKQSPDAIPLVSAQAVGGFAGKDFLISENDVQAYYVVPKFRNLSVDFMIEVIGDSMMPRLFPGDIIACSIITNPSFIQWNKPHLIATREQGLIVKRLRRGTDKDCLLAVSDNPDYDPFDIPKADIVGIARIVGVIHAE